MPLFSVRGNKASDAELVKKSKLKAKQPVTVRSSGLLATLTQIKEKVDALLGKYAKDYEVVTDVSRLAEYIENANNVGYIAIDTETTGLDPMLDKIVGLCLYTKGEKGVYVPINHVSYITGDRVDNQLSEKQVSACLKKLFAKIIMFNAAFDIRVIRNQLGVYLTCYWDCYLASRLLNENEPKKGLKALHQKYVLRDAEDEFSFDALFRGITADKIPISSFYLYATHDAVITYEYFEYQRNWLSLDSERDDMRNIAWVFFNIEMPCVEIVCDMEDNGIELDLDYAHKLSVTYNERLNAKSDAFYRVLDKYTAQIESFRESHKNAKLDNPINIASPTQIAILLYDVLGVESVDKKRPRGTGEDILKKIMSVNESVADLCNAILEYREVDKLLSTYIDKLPNIINPNDKRIHCKFNQYGADTGRFSSQDPNLQNIPSHNKDIRKMFKATDGYVLMSSDYSQQEPRLMAQLCADSRMLNAYQEGKDLYAEIAAMSFNTKYENCLEHFPIGAPIKKINGKWQFATEHDYDKLADGEDVYAGGKARRSQAKSILLGVLYGRGVPSIAEQLGTTTEKAQAIKDSVFKGFPAIPKFEQDSLEMAEELGYVTTLWGRKRRLPDLQLPEYEFKWKDGAHPSDDLLNFDDADESAEEYVPEEYVRKYLRLLQRARPWDKRKIFEQANKEGIWIVDNGLKIADAERKCVNARIQGSAADMSKLAMIKVGNDERLKELGFRLLIPVHDELIGECPEENMAECKERFAMLMSEAAKSRLTIPIKCDVEVTRNWYGEPYAGTKQKQKESNTAREFENELLGNV